MPDFNTADDVKSELVLNSDNSTCIKLSKPDGSHACIVVGVRTDGTVQRFTISAEDAVALGLQRDANGFVTHIG